MRIRFMAILTQNTDTTFKKYNYIIHMATLRAQTSCECELYVKRILSVPISSLNLKMYFKIRAYFIEIHTANICFDMKQMLYIKQNVLTSKS